MRIQRSIVVVSILTSFALAESINVESSAEKVALNSPFAIAKSFPSKLPISLKPIVTTSPAALKSVESSNHQTANNVSLVKTSKHQIPQSSWIDNLPILFSLIAVVIFGIVGGRISERMGQPQMLGMLLSGILVRNILSPWILPIPHTWSSKLWSLALSSVIARAGLSVRKEIIIKNTRATLILGTVPILFEAVFLANLAGIFFNLPLSWMYTLSFGVASISPGVVVPLLLNLMDRPVWKSSQLPPMLLASTGIDVTVATTCFGVALASIAGHKHEHDHDSDQKISSYEAMFRYAHSSWIFRGLEEIFVGVVLGVIVGSIGWVLYSRTTNQSRTMIRDSSTIHLVAEPIADSDTAFNQPTKIAASSWFSDGSSMAPSWIIFTLFFISFIIMAYTKSHGYPGAASSCVIIGWCIVTNTWNSESVDAANRKLKLVWKYAEPLLFPVIGAAVSLREIPLWLLGMAMMVVGMSVLARATCSLIAARFFAGLKWKECVFISGVWCGKASVQAALCHATFDYIHRYHLESTIEYDYAKIVFSCMLSAILIGGPIASAWVSIFASSTIDSNSFEIPS